MACNGGIWCIWLCMPWMYRPAAKTSTFPSDGTERTGHRMDVGTHKTSVAPRHSGHRPCQNSFIAGARRLGTPGARVLEDKSQNSKFPNEPEILNESFCILGIWPHLSRTGWKCQETWKPRMHQNHCIGCIQCFSKKVWKGANLVDSCYAARNLAFRWWPRKCSLLRRGNFGCPLSKCCKTIQILRHRQATWKSEVQCYEHFVDGPSLSALACPWRKSRISWISFTPSDPCIQNMLTLTLQTL